MLNWHREISQVRDVLLEKLFWSDYVRSTQCPQACSKTCPKTSSQASEIAISKAAHLAASTKMENRKLERRLQRRRNEPVNHRQLVQTLHEEWYTISMPIFGVWLTQRDGYAIMWSSHEQGIPTTKKWFPNLQWWGTNKWKFFFKIKFLLKTKLTIFLSIEQGISIQNLKYVASVQLE